MNNEEYENWIKEREEEDRIAWMNKKKIDTEAKKTIKTMKLNGADNETILKTLSDAGYFIPASFRSNFEAHAQMYIGWKKL